MFRFVQCPRGATEPWRAFRRWSRGLCCAGWLLALQAAAAAEPASREYDVKAVLLYNFTQFVSWPATAFSSPEAPIVIGVFGNDPFEGALAAISGQQTVEGRRIVVERCHSLEAARHCQILFVSADERPNWPKLAVALQGQPVLTVAEFDGFVVGGGMIHLAKNLENKIRLRINLDAVRAASLTMSVKLLRVAEITSDRRNQP